VATEVFKAREGSDVLVLRPPGGGDSLIRVDDGSWDSVSNWGTVTGAELRDAWIRVEDEAEASKLVKDAMSSSTVNPAA